MEIAASGTTLQAVMRGAGAAPGTDPRGPGHGGIEAGPSADPPRPRAVADSVVLSAEARLSVGLQVERRLEVVLSSRPPSEADLSARESEMRAWADAEHRYHQVFRALVYQVLGLDRHAGAMDTESVLITLSPAAVKRFEGMLAERGLVRPARPAWMDSGGSGGEAAESGGTDALAEGMSLCFGGADGRRSRIHVTFDLRDEAAGLLPGGDMKATPASLPFGSLNDAAAYYRRPAASADGRSQPEGVFRELQWAVRDADTVLAFSARSSGNDWTARIFIDDTDAHGRIAAALGADLFERVPAMMQG